MTITVRCSTTTQIIQTAAHTWHQRVPSSASLLTFELMLSKRENSDNQGKKNIHLPLAVQWEECTVLPKWHFGLLWSPSMPEKLDLSVPQMYAWLSSHRDLCPSSPDFSDLFQCLVWTNSEKVLHKLVLGDISGSPQAYLSPWVLDWLIWAVTFVIL